MDYKELLKLAVRSAIEGGEEILDIYNTDFLVETKSDDTPVTLADKKAGHTISAILSNSGIPVISEEEEILDFSERKNWEHVWIVDPLDGTKEYVKRNGEFAVNIALVKNNKPVIGVIYAPVLKVIYFAALNEGSFKIMQNDLVFELTKDELPSNLFKFAVPLPLGNPPQVYTVVVSRSHLSREVQQRINELKTLYGNVNCISVGSSIKQCWVAEGRAHEYPRFGATMEWDTAAGQCILEQCGGRLVDFETGKPMLYNKRDLRNNFFIARCN